MNDLFESQLSFSQIECKTDTEMKQAFLVMCYIYENGNFKMWAKYSKMQQKLICRFVYMCMYSLTITDQLL